MGNTVTSLHIPVRKQTQILNYICSIYFQSKSKTLHNKVQECYIALDKICTSTYICKTKMITCKSFPLINSYIISITISLSKCHNNVGCDGFLYNLQILDSLLLLQGVPTWACVLQNVFIPETALPVVEKLIRVWPICECDVVDEECIFTHPVTLLSSTRLESMCVSAWLVLESSMKFIVVEL